MRQFTGFATTVALAASQLAAVAPALSQSPIAVPADRMARPEAPIARPTPLPAPLPTRPTPLPGRPDNGNNNGGGWGNGNNGGNWNGNNQGGNWSGPTIRCESQGNRYRECRADTRGGVRLVRVRGGQCRQGRSWGYQSNFIWVNHGCRADFQTRFGSSSSNSSGPSAGAVIGGVAVAAGLIALLSSSTNSSNATAPPAAGQPATPPPVFTPPPGSTGRPAIITANTGGVTPSARPSLNTCLTEAARQIGVTGGTEIRLDQIDDVQPGNGGYRFRFRLVGVYPDETRTIPTFCRATPTTLVELSFG